MSIYHSAAALHMAPRNIKYGRQQTKGKGAGGDVTEIQENKCLYKQALEADKKLLSRDIQASMNKSGEGFIKYFQEDKKCIICK